MGAARTRADNRQPSTSPTERMRLQGKGGKSDGVGIGGRVGGRRYGYKLTSRASSSESERRSNRRRMVACRQGWLWQHWSNVRIGEKTGRNAERLRNRRQGRIARCRVKRENTGYGCWDQVSLRQHVQDLVDGCFPVPLSPR